MKNARFLIFGFGFLVLAFSLKAQKQATKTTLAAGVTVVPGLDTNFTTRKLILNEPLFHYEILFSEGDPVEMPDKSTAPARGKHDFLQYIPIEGSSEHGWLWVNHEELRPHPKLGFGGGASLLEVSKKSGTWETLGKYAIDFDPVGGTGYNCLGGLSPMGTILTSEETEPLNNQDLTQLGFSDTTDYDGKPRYLNYGWMVEVDPVSRKAIRKLWQMGRFMHEAVYCMPDSQTVYLMDDYAPGVFFKFVARNKGNYEQGQLFAFKQSSDGLSGSWLTLPMTMEALSAPRNEALKLGATMFIRLEDIELLPNGNFLITETGIDLIDLSSNLSVGGSLAHHLREKQLTPNIISDLNGRILHYNPKNERISVFLESGQACPGLETHLSNPDNIAIRPGGKTLVIHEDINGTSHGRVPFHSIGTLFNEIYLLDLAIPNPSLKDLQRFGICPQGAEGTGPCWTPDGKTLFFDIQHPDPTNPPPFNKSCTVAVTGWK